MCNSKCHGMETRTNISNLLQFRPVKKVFFLGGGALFQVVPIERETETVADMYTIRLPTDATLYFVYLFPLFLPYMFRALISPSSGVSQAVFYIQPFGSCGVYVAHLRVPVDWFVMVVSLFHNETTTTIQSTGTRR